MKSLLLLFVLLPLVPFAQGARPPRFDAFVPKGFVIAETITGDLDGDGRADRVLLVKATDTSKFVAVEYRGILDRNRRGLIVLLNRKEGFQAVVRNYHCFSSENEDGGVYFPPELCIEIDKGKLGVHYAHGRYGWWRYIFRKKGSDFECIGYDRSSNHGPVTMHSVSINFLTGWKRERENTNELAETDGEEIFKETWKKIRPRKPIRLSAVKDFDELDLSW